jgi:hypothetical protein
MSEDRLPPRLWYMGRELHSRFRNFFENPPGPASTPLELLLATLDNLEKKVQPAGRGTRVFPYNRVVVHIFQPNAERAAVESVFRQLEARLRERLAELRCDAGGRIATELVFAPAAAADGAPALAVECFNDVQVPVEHAAGATYPALRVTVVKGCGQPGRVHVQRRGGRDRPDGGAGRRAGARAAQSRRVSRDP